MILNYLRRDFDFHNLFQYRLYCIRSTYYTFLDRKNVDIILRGDMTQLLVFVVPKKKILPEFNNLGSLALSMQSSILPNFKKHNEKKTKKSFIT